MTSEEIYNIKYWGNNYFGIDKSGNVCIHLPTNNHASVSIAALVKSARDKGLNYPILLRFPDLINQRILELGDAFNQEMNNLHYTGSYTAVYPIKVNQNKSVIDAVVEHDNYSIGLEAGSKPELMITLAVSKPNSVIICNGYKDKEYIRLALIGQQMGRNVFIIIEKLSELNLVLEQAKELAIIPKLGVRIRLRSIAKGKWQNTGGQKAKFGLTSSQLLQLINKLKQENSLEILSILHFHMGSQIANIHDIKSGLQEGAKVYAELMRLGANIHTIDVGGGLGVDYEGSQSRNDCSINYNIKEYAHNIVNTIHDSCNKNNLKHPNIITEAGRAMVAHHAILITNIIDCEQYLPSQVYTKPRSSHRILNTIWETYNNLDNKSLLESHHEISHCMSEANSLFIHSELSIEELAQAEALYLSACYKIKNSLNHNIRSQRELHEQLEQNLSCKLFCNFSIFQSVPDIWAINQIFPIMPITKLDEPLTTRAVLQDLTCDSDGRIDQYINAQNIEPTLPVPAYDKNDPFLIGLFLVGAYQETLGDIHNLFGDTDSVNIIWNDKQQQFNLTSPFKGQNVSDLLTLIQHDKNDLLKSYTMSLHSSNLTNTVIKQYLDELNHGINGYTYLK